MAGEFPKGDGTGPQGGEVLLHRFPDMLLGIAFGTVGREVHEFHHAGVQGEPESHVESFVVLGAVPDEQDGKGLAFPGLQEPIPVRLHAVQELNGGVPVEPTAEEGDDLSRGDGQGAKHRYAVVLVPIPVDLNDGRVPDLAPSIGAVRLVLDVGFICYQDIEKAPFFRRFRKRTLNFLGFVSSFR